MTGQKAYDLLDLLCDKSGTAYFIDSEKALLLEKGTYSFLKNISDKFENNLDLIDSIHTIVRGPEPITIASSLGDLPTGFLYRLNAYYGTPDVPLRYIKLLRWSHEHADPNNEPTAEYPAWTLTGNKVLVSGFTTGAISMFYMVKPTFDFDNLANEWIDLPEQTQHDLIEWAFKAAIVSMSDQRFQQSLHLTRDQDV